MKKKILLFTSSLAMVSAMLLSNNAGPAHSGNGDRTGRLGTTCGTAGCHSGGGGTTTCKIEVLDKASGNPVTKFVANTVYTVKISGTNAALPKFGFQLVAVNGTGGAGTWQNIPSNVRQATVSGLPVIEHQTALSKDGSGNYSVSVDWKAPAISSVTFHGIINAVDGTGSTGGDNVSPTTQLTLQDGTSVADLEKKIKLTISPNPFVNRLKLAIDNSTPGDYTIVAYDLTGKKMFVEQYHSASPEFVYNTADWKPGIYYVQVTNNEGVKHTTPLVKY